MQSDSNTSIQRQAHANPNDSSVDSSITAFATDANQMHDAVGMRENLSSNNDRPPSPDASMQSSSVENTDQSPDQRNAESAELIDPLFPAEPSKFDSRAKRVLKELDRLRDSRTHNRPMLLDDLKELGMAGELSEDSKFVTMSFEDSHRLVMTMRMAELILNDTMQTDRKDRIAQIKAQLDAEHCPNMSTLLQEIEKAQYDLTQRHSFQSVGVFEPGMYTLGGFILFETMMIAKGIDWLAQLSIAPDLEMRRATLAVFSELQAAYSSERTLHELYFHQHDDKKQLEERVRGVMSDLEERIVKASIRTGSVTAKREAVANEVKAVTALVEEMLGIAKQSYCAALTASHMGHIALEHSVTISQLRTRIFDLEDEIASWVFRCSQDASAAMTLAEENVVLAQANRELHESMQRLHERQRQQTTTLDGLTANLGFGTNDTQTPEIFTNGKDLLNLVDLPGVYSRLIGDLRATPVNDKGKLSILAPSTVATRAQLVESLERQLRRPAERNLNAANAYVNVATSRAAQAKQRGLAVYGEKRILKRDVKALFGCEPSGLRKHLPTYLKAPLPIASDQHEGLMDDLQKGGAIVFVDRFFDAATGNQIQDMQVLPDALPATVLLTNAMNTNAALDDLLRQGDIPRLLNGKLKELKNSKKDRNVPPAPSVSSGNVPKTPTVSQVVSDGTSVNRNAKRKDMPSSSPSPSPLPVSKALSPMLNGDVLHPFAPQQRDWDELWLEKDNGRALREFTIFYRDREQSEVDKAAINDVCIFFMKMKANTRCYQQQVEWANPSTRVRQVLDTASKGMSAPAAPARKGAKQQRRSTSGAIRSSSESLTGLAVEWNTEVETAWVWKDNQEGAAKADPWLFTRLLQKADVIPSDGDYLTPGKKVLPIGVLANTCKQHRLVSTPYSYAPSYKGGKGKGKDKKGKDGKRKGKNEPPQASSSVLDASEAELWMLPYPASVNQEDRSYLILGHNNSQVRVTEDNWDTLRFNTRTLNPEYFPASYRWPVPTGPSLDNPRANATFPRSTITGTLEELRQLLKVPLLSKSKKVSSETYKALSLEGPSGAADAADEETAPKRIRVFLKLCSVFIPCECDEYYHAVSQLDVEVHPDVMTAWQPYLHVRDEILVILNSRIATATSVLLQVLYFLQEGHVQYLLRQYRGAFVDLFGASAIPRGGTSLVPSGRAARSPRATFCEEPSKVEDEAEDDVDMDNDASGSNFDNTRVDKDDEAHTSVSSITQTEVRRLRLETTTTSDNTEAAGFGSDISPRTESGDNEGPGQAEGY